MRYRVWTRRRVFKSNRSVRYAGWESEPADVYDTLERAEAAAATLMESSPSGSAVVVEDGMTPLLTPGAA